MRRASRRATLAVRVGGKETFGRTPYFDQAAIGGGGMWFSPLLRTNTTSLSVANSPEETLFYMRIGFHS